MLLLYLLLFNNGVIGFKEMVGDRIMETDIAWLTAELDTTQEEVLYFHQRSCFQCSWTSINSKNGEYEIDMRWPIRFQIFKGNSPNVTWASTSGICNSKFHQLGQGGIYHLNRNCDIELTNADEYNQIAWTYYLPIWSAIIAILGAFLIYSLILYWNKKEVKKQEESDQKIEEEKLEEKPKKKKRLISLDTFRGFSITFMVFANYGGADYWFFEHAAWDGLTFADLLMPWFLFMAGVSTRFGVVSMSKQRTTMRIFYEISVRTIKLFILGLFVTGGGSEWDRLRIPGVLQRIAFSYFVVSISHLASPNVLHVPATLKEELKTYWPEHLISHICLIIFCFVTYLLPVPDCPTGYVGPGGIAEDGKYEKCIGGAAAYIDKMILGKDHMYRYPTAREIYYPDGEKVYFDPEGILGSLTSVYLTYLGLQAGKVFSYYPNFKTNEHFKQIIVHLAIGILSYGILGTILATAGSKYSDQGELIANPIVPINKNLWSISFVFLMGSLGYLMLLIFFMIIDYWNIWNGAPFYYAGRNSILIYILHGMIDGVPWDWKCKYDSHSEEMLMLIINCCIWLSYSYWCHQRNFFVVI